MSSKPVGGRGQKAPYETVVIRIPEPIAPRVRFEIEIFHKEVTSGKISERDIEKPYWQEFEPSYVTKSIAIEEAEQILKGKKSARVSLGKLLQVLYDDKNIQLKDLRK